MLYIWTSATGLAVKNALESVASKNPSETAVRYLDEVPDIEALQLVAGDVVFGVGNHVLNRLKKAGIVPKNLSITSMRSKPLKLPSGAFLCFSYDPQIKNSDYSKYIDLQVDYALAVRLHEAGSREPELGLYKWVDNFEWTVNQVNELFESTKQPVPISVDLETVGLDPYDPDKHIVSISVTVKPEVSELVANEGVDDQPEKGSVLWNQIEWLLNSERIKTRGANFKFDLGWISQKWGIRCTNFSMDTTIVGSLLDENRSNSLNNHAKLYTCLSGDTRVLLSNGEWEEIRRLVKNKYKGRVKAYKAGAIVDAPVVGWVKNKHPSGDWRAIRFTTGHRSYARYTPDHEFLTADGFCEIQDLIPGDKVLTHHKTWAGDSLSILLGSLLGDGGIDRVGGYARLNLYQSACREDYINWKASALGLKINTQYKGSLATVRGAGKFSYALAELDNDLERVPGHKHRKPVPSYTLLEMMGDLGLAVWYQDDGSLVRGKAQIRCCCTGYEDEALDYFVNRFGKGVTYHKNGTFWFGGSSSGLLFEAIKPYAHPLFDYKYPFKVKKTPVFVDVATKPLAREVADVVHGGVKSAGTYESYCITVEHVHNFVTPQGVVSNCLGGYDDAFGAKHDKSRMDLVLEADPEGFLTYAGGDTDACYRVAEAQIKELSKNKRLANFYINLMHPAAQAFGRMEEVGVLVDREYFAELEDKLTTEAATLEAKALGMIPKRIQNKYSDNLSLTRPVILKEYLFSSMGLNLKPKMFSEKTQEPSTAKGHLSMFIDDERARPFIETIEALNTTKKTLSTYVKGFMSYLRADGRLHPTYLLHRGAIEGSTTDGGTITGRSSATAPAIQTLPKNSKHAKALRKGYIAPPGYKIVNFDFSQGELRVAACVANEKVMINAYLEGLDMHTLTGAQMHGITIDEALQLSAKDEKAFSALRQSGKRGNFGMLYGISAPGFKKYAWAFDGVLLELAQAERQIADFFELYKGLLQWHKNCKIRAHKTGQIVSPLGRVKRLPLIRSNNSAEVAKSERQAINAGVQSTLSDLTQLALAEFNSTYGYPNSCQFFMMCHDALTAYVKEDEVDYWVPRVREIMENLPLKERFNWSPQLMFKVDAEVGYNLAEMSDYK